MSNLSIVIVDDDSMILMLHEHVLRKANLLNGKSALSAFDGQEALQVLEQNAHPDTTFLVLLDLNMPVMDGWEFLDALEESNISSDVFVSIVTSSLDYTDKHKAEEYRKILSYIEKPLSLKSLEELKSMTQLNAFFK
jgi:CheY-like chemotaxis protein